MNPESASVVRDGDNVLFIDRKNREYLRRVRAGRPVKLRDGTIDADELIGREEGRYVRNSRGDAFLLLRPTYAQLIPNLPRQAQVIYPKDAASILLWGDIRPGDRVIEVGTGPGALSMALLRAIGPAGALYSYELREEFAAMARGNVERFHGACDNWTIRIRDAREGFDERDIDRITVDMPEPWDLLPGVAEALRPGGVLVIYVPGATQLKQTGDALAEDRRFGATQTFETLLRTWHVAGRSVRPDHRMVAHTGFLMVTRRVLPADSPQ